MVESIFSEWIGLWWTVVVWGMACAPGEMLFGRERHTITSRFRWAFFWSFTLFVQAVSVWALGQALPRIGLGPLFVLDFRETGENWHPALRTGFLAVVTLAWSFVYDFSYYWFHRLQHAVPFLWRFHATHHSIEELNGMNCGHHWSEGFLRVPLLLLPLALLVDLRFQEVAIIASIVGAWTQFVHANSTIDFGRLRWLFVSPRFHRVHHSTSSEHFNRNFAGVFPIIDVMFGTGKFPAEGETIEVGLTDKHEPRTIGEFLLVLRDKQETRLTPAPAE